MDIAIEAEDFYVEDWAGNVCLFGRCFATFDAADDYLTEMIERNHPDTLENESRFYEERGEYFIKSSKSLTAKPPKKATAHLRSRENFRKK